jgi:pyruvate formate-lyase activating enzyme-like uncharacterized protein
MKTPFASFCNNTICDGCKSCVRGEKLVLFMGGKCYRNCWYCSLSDSRSKGAMSFANERPIKRINDLIKEVVESNSKGAGITGGDPLLYLNKTIKYSKALKERFGKDFHIHIYLPLSLVNEKKLIKLKKVIDEIRFHPSFLVNSKEESIKKEIEKIYLATKIFGKNNIGIEIPIIPDKKKESYDLIKKLNKKIGFVNLNELEISERNMVAITKRFSLNEDTNTIRGSVSAGKWIIHNAKKDKLKINIHLCTAKTKDSYQYLNRLKRHTILPFGNKTNEGTVVYFAIYPKDLKTSINNIKRITSNFFIDKKNERIIISKKEVSKIYYKTDLKIARVEERPTFDQERLEFGFLGE